MLESRCGRTEGDFPTCRIGKGNPYSKCRSCGRSVPDISSKGHYKGCLWVHYFKSARGMRKVMEKEELSKKSLKRD